MLKTSLLPYLVVLNVFSKSWDKHMVFRLNLVNLINPMAYSIIKNT